MKCLIEFLIFECDDKFQNRNASSVAVHYGKKQRVNEIFSGCFSANGYFCVIKYSHTWHILVFGTPKSLVLSVQEAIHVKWHSSVNHMQPTSNLSTTIMVSTSFVAFSLYLTVRTVKAWWHWTLNRSSVCKVCFCVSGSL